MADDVTPIDRTVSFRATLKGEIDDLLADENLICAATSSAIVTVSAELANYTEEGIRLSPEIYFCSDLRVLSRVLPGAEILPLGEGPQDDSTASRALKECAPLATDGWVIFVERSANEFKYGVLSPTNLPMSMTPYEALMEDDLGEDVAIVTRRIASNCVEIKGGNGHRRCLFFSDQRVEAPIPSEAVIKFARAVTTQIKDKDLAKSTERYVFRLLSELLEQSHGALLVVQGHRRKVLPGKLNDSVLLPRPISIAKRVKEYTDAKSDETLSKLLSLTPVLRGMINSDGIIVFRDDASIVAYRTFYQPRSSDAQTAIGGARKRTFEGLKSMVRSDLEGVLMRSQDGYTDFYGGQQP